MSDFSSCASRWIKYWNTDKYSDSHLKKKIFPPEFAGKQHLKLVGAGEDAAAAVYADDLREDGEVEIVQTVLRHLGVVALQAVHIHKQNLRFAASGQY